MRMRVLVACDLRAGDATGASVAIAVSDATAAGAALGERGGCVVTGGLIGGTARLPGWFGVWGAPGAYLACCAREIPA